MSNNSERFKSLPQPRENRDVLTFDDWPDHSRTPKCTAHHTYVRTVIDHAHGVWVCPSCGVFSDRVESYSSGHGLVSPEGFSQRDIITVDGRVLIRGDVGTFPTDDGLDGAVLNSPYEAKEDIKSFEGWRQWRPELSAWVVAYSKIDDFAAEMESRGWIVINVHECVVRRADIHSFDLDHSPS